MINDCDIGIKKPGQVEYISKEEYQKRVRLIAKSKRDIVWWAENYFTIVNMSTGKEIIKLYPKQKELLQHILNNDRSIILASRQTGKCVFYNTKIKLRNKKTLEINEYEIGDFYNLIIKNSDKQIYKTYKHSIQIENVSDTKIRKFIDSQDIDDYEVLTDTEWVDIKKIHKTVKYKVWEVTTKKHKLLCADNHIVFKDNFEQSFVKNLVVGDAIITEDGIENVISVKEKENYENMFDLELGEDSNHRYFTNGILSHNTTTYTIFCLWYAMFFNDKRIMICSNKLQTSTEIIRKIALSYELIPNWLKPGVTVYNKTEITFSNGSTIKGFATGSSSSRGFSGNCVIIDEMAFIPTNIMDEFFASVMPVISSGKNSKAIVVSTPNGQDNLYYQLWKEANSKDVNKNKEGWKPFRIDWFDTGGIRDQKWKEQQIATIGIQRWNQEFGNEFINSSSVKKLLSDDTIEKYRMRIGEYKKLGINQGKDLAIISKDGHKTFVFRMYHDFQPNRTYLASSDIAEGIGKDASVLYIWDITDTSRITMCAKFSDSNTSILDFAYVTNEILKMYNKPFLACESNGISLGYIEQLRQTYEYDNFVRLNRDNGCGILSHVQIKTKSCLWFRDMMTTMGFGFELYDLALIDEFSTFIKKDTKVHDVYAAVGDNHDDHVMTMIWMCWILNQENLEKYYVVGDTFTSSLGNTYPRTIQPLFEYTQREVEEIGNIPQIREFQTYKELHKEEYLNYLKQRDDEIRNAMQMLGVNTIVGEMPSNVNQLYNPNQMVYTQEDMLRGVRRRIGEQSTIDSSNRFWGSTGSDFSNASNLFGFDDDSDGPMW